MYNVDLVDYIIVRPIFPIRTHSFYGWIDGSITVQVPFVKSDRDYIFHFF